MREALSETLASALRRADEEARAKNQEFVGTEHLFLGILSNGQGDAIRALKSAADIAALRQSLEKSLTHGKDAPIITGRLPLSPRAQRIINSAIASAQSAGESSVSTRFIVLALMDEPQSTTLQLLRDAGADMENLSRLLLEKSAEHEK